MGFGTTVRKLRQAEGLSIAQFAKKVDISPTYLAPIEREVFPPPAEDKIVRIAKALNQNPDVLLAQAGRVADDLQRIIRKHPAEVGRLLRSLRGKSAERIVSLSVNGNGARGARKAARKNGVRRAARR